MSEKKYTDPVVTMLPDVKEITALMKKSEVVTKGGLRIQSWFVREGQGKPFEVQILGSDAELVRDQSYTVMLRERTQTRIEDQRVFTELQIAAAQPHN